MEGWELGRSGGGGGASKRKRPGGLGGFGRCGSSFRSGACGQPCKRVFLAIPYVFWSLSCAFQIQPQNPHNALSRRKPGEAHGVATPCCIELLVFSRE